MKRFGEKLTYANVMATVAVFIALGGASYAALKLPKNSVGTKQLKKNAVTLDKIEPGTRASLKGQKGDVGMRGETGLTGPPGAPGDSGGFNGATAGGDLTGTYPNPRVGLVQIGGADETEDEGFPYLLPPWPQVAAITTDGDADSDSTVRILNTSSQQLLARANGTQVSLGPGGAETVVVGAPTTIFIWTADGSRSWLVTCVDVFLSSEIRCQGLASRVG